MYSVAALADQASSPIFWFTPHKFVVAPECCSATVLCRQFPFPSPDWFMVVRKEAAGNRGRLLMYSVKLQLKVMTS